MKGPELLKHYEDNWVTDMGAWFPGERVVLRGKDVFTELNNHTWMEYLVYAVTGRESPKIARLMEALWSITTSYPDPRLWNNRIAALAGTARSTGVLAIAAATSVSEAQIYGLKPIKGATDLLYRMYAKKSAGHSIDRLIQEELKQYRSVYGYGRPIIKADERVEPLMQFARSIDAADGRYITLAFEIEDYLKNSRLKYQINIAAVAGGLVADQGLTANEFYHLATLCFSAGMFPCYLDAKESEGCFFPLRTERINYIGSNSINKWGGNNGDL